MLERTYMYAPNSMACFVGTSKSLARHNTELRPNIDLRQQQESTSPPIDIIFMKYADASIDTAGVCFCVASVCIGVGYGYLP